AGEGGEFESLVLDGPNFSQKIVLGKTTIHTESENCAQLVIHDVHLQEKKS
ncbi:MAG: TIGR00289 family protein, partial [Candidatus Woesearchaeota archaeon]